jgi:hypothetical protein
VHEVAKPIEESVDGVLERSYLLGLRVEGQDDPAGTVWFLHDGHGSNRGLIESNASVSAEYDYQAFGETPHDQNRGS